MKGTEMEGIRIREGQDGRGERKDMDSRNVEKERTPFLEHEYAYDKVEGV